LFTTLSAAAGPGYYCTIRAGALHKRLKLQIHFQRAPVRQLADATIEIAPGWLMRVR